MATKKSTVHRTADGCFEYGFVASEKDMAGKMLPHFQPYWWAQYLGDGTQQFFATERAALDWIESWKEIAK